MHRVVVWDPKGEFWEGSLVEERVARVLQERGVAMLPVVPELLRRAGVGGFHKRAWGSGWPLDFMAPRLVCPLTMFLSTALRTLHWVARLVPDDAHRQPASEGKTFTQGSVRLVGDSGQDHARMTTIANTTPAVDGAKLGKLDAEGGWTVGGDAEVNPSSDGFYGFGLYGTMPGVRVVWAAVSLTE